MALLKFETNFGSITLDDCDTGISIAVNNDKVDVIECVLEEKRKFYIYDCIKAHSTVAIECAAQWLLNQYAKDRPIDFRDYMKNYGDEKLERELREIYADTMTSKYEMEIDRIEFLPGVPTPLQFDCFIWSGHVNSTTPPAISGTRKPKQDKFTSNLSIFDRIVPSRRKAKEDAAMSYSAALSQYEALCTSVELHNNGVRSLRQGCQNRDVNSVEDYANLILWLRDIPCCLRGTHHLRYDAVGILVVDCHIGNVEILPDKACKIDRYGYPDDVPLSAAQAARIYDRMCYAFVLRTAADLLVSDVCGAIETVCINLMVDTIEPATGKQCELCLLSLKTSLTDIGSVNIAAADPIACFKHLGGRVAARPSQMKAVTPYYMLHK